MNIVIETGLELEEELRLQNSFRSLGLRVVTINYLKYQDPPLAVEDPVFLRGSLQATAYARENYANWLIYESLDQYTYTPSYAETLLERMLNSQFKIIPFGELKDRRDELFREFGIDGHVFIRPNAGNKAFTGKPIAIEEWFRSIDRLSLYNVRISEPVVVTQPQPIVAEYRYYIKDGQIVTGSMYKPTKEKYEGDAEAQELVDFCTQQGYNPDPVWVLDLCRTPDGKLHILEAGGSSSSGLYKVDTDKLAKAFVDSFSN